MESKEIELAYVLYLPEGFTEQDVVKVIIDETEDEVIIKVYSK